jgi:hypothetical protein
VGRPEQPEGWAPRLPKDWTPQLLPQVVEKVEDKLLGARKTSPSYAQTVPIYLLDPEPMKTIEAQGEQ